MAGFGLLVAGCHSRPATLADRIDLLKRQVTADSQTLRDLEENDYPLLRSDFRRCDSLLQFMDTTQLDAAFVQLNLVLAYLNQFADVKDDMRQKMDYSIVQLDRLKTDAESHFICDSLASVYLDAETKVADTLHHRVLYFQDRFGQCRVQLSTLNK